MKSIRTQMFIYLIIATVIVFGGLALLMDHALEALPEYTVMQFQAIADARADELSKELGGIVDLVQMTSQTPLVRSMEIENIKPFLSTLIIDGKIRNMTISDVYGNAWTTYDQNIDISGQEQYHKLIIEGKEFIISKPFYSPYIKEDIPIITVSHVIRDGEETLGLVNAVVSAQFLDQVVSQIEFKERGVAWIIDDEGRIVAHPEQDISIDYSLDDFMSEEDSKVTILSQDSGSVYYKDSSGLERIGIFSTIDNSDGWKLIISVTSDEAFAEINEINRDLRNGFVAAIIIIGFFSYVYSGSISRPIMNLKKVFEQAAHGDLRAKADEMVNNEVGLAGRSFNLMIDQIKNLTYRDPITEIYNYNRFMFEMPGKFKQHLIDEKISYVAVLSVNDFKKINSIGGYNSGNFVLKELSGKLRTFIRPDELVASSYGDEIILFLSDLSENDISKRIDALMELCSFRTSISGIEYHLSVSMGISLVESEEFDPEDIVKRAKIAKLMTKKSGGDKFVLYNTSLHESVERERRIEEAIHHGIENNEFHLLYQPIVDIDTNKIIASEALLRWSNTDYGQIAIPYVIELAEKNGDIIEIGKFVLETACIQNNKWHAEGLDDHVISVNVSPLQFEDSRFLDIVCEVLEQTKMDPKYLEIEITETNAMLKVEEKIEKMRRLKEMGIKIAIDDFGTGYSSLSYFTKFPIDTLKIDKSFIGSMLDEDNAKSIVVMVVNMARAMGISTTAEGVETIEQFKMLRSIGADKIQGYLISRPVTAEFVPGTQMAADTAMRVPGTQAAVEPQGE
ncbi:MAG: EAL domain-containing protein [Bacillota bacterium]|nr:EAL domain-containing protein [Bacillota bacterium]